jgi:5'-nucleotidase
VLGAGTVSLGSRGRRHARARRHRVAVYNRRLTMVRILVTNDDGYRSEGIHALAEALKAIGEPVIVAPMTEASAIGHALTLRHPLRLEHVSPNVYGVDGTPTDCVNIAVTQVFRGLPDLVVSGINKGWNLGDDVTYSGTVAGALEAALLGIPAIAVSLRQTRADYDFAHAARAAALMAAAILRRPLPARTFLNINVPKGEPKGYRATVQAKRNHITSVAERHDPKGRPYYWIEEGQNDWEPHDRSDYQAVRDGYVSITPLQPDLTAHHALDAVEAQTTGIQKTGALT